MKAKQSLKLGKVDLNIKTENISPKVKSLSGIVKLPKNFDEKKEFHNYLEKKYGELFANSFQ